MIFKDEVKTGLRAIGKNNLIKNESILEIFENIGGEHSNSVSFGANDIEKTGASWVLLDWKVKVINRPLYAEKLKVETWGRRFLKAYTYRDYKIYNSKGELSVIATSKWALIDINTRRVLRLTDELRDKYKPEKMSVFNEDELEKIECPEEFSSQYEYTVGRKDIDVNKHMHNTNYLSLAYEILPEKVYENRPYNLFRISYKKEVKLGDTVICKYTEKEDKYVVAIFNKDTNVLNALVELYKNEM